MNNKLLTKAEKSVKATVRGIVWDISYASKVSSYLPHQDICQFSLQICWVQIKPEVHTRRLIGRSTIQGNYYYFTNAVLWFKRIVDEGWVQTLFAFKSLCRLPRAVGRRGV